MQDVAVAATWWTTWGQFVLAPVLMLVGILAGVALQGINASRTASDARLARVEDAERQRKTMNDQFWHERQQLRDKELILVKLERYSRLIQWANDFSEGARTKDDALTPPNVEVDAAVLSLASESLRGAYKEVLRKRASAPPSDADPGVAREWSNSYVHCVELMERAVRLELSPSQPPEYSEVTYR
jgi:hypothetical protein